MLYGVRKNPKILEAGHLPFPGLADSYLMFRLSYAGRQASASTAAGQKEIYEAEQNRLIGRALGKE